MLGSHAGPTSTLKINQGKEVNKKKKEKRNNNIGNMGWIQSNHLLTNE